MTIQRDDEHELNHDMNCVAFEDNGDNQMIMIVFPIQLSGDYCSNVVGVSPLDKRCGLLWKISCNLCDSMNLLRFVCRPLLAETSPNLMFGRTFY